jgi:histidine ammonia-lyase
MSTVLLDGETLKMEDVVAAARQGADAGLTAEARSQVPFLEHDAVMCH